MVEFTPRNQGREGARGSFPSRFLQSAMGQDFIFFFKLLPYPTPPYQPPWLQDPWGSHSSLLHDFSAPLGITSTSRTLTQPQFSFQPPNPTVHSKAGSLFLQGMPVPWKDRKLSQRAESGNAPDTGKKEETPHKPP